MQNRAQLKAGFSLVEVVIALGIVSFALLAVIGLLPIGMQTNRDSVEETQALTVLGAIAADRRVSPPAGNSLIYNIPPLSTATTSTIYVKEDGTASATPSDARYRVVVTSQVPPTYGNPTLMHLYASWPPMATKNNSSVEILAAFAQ
jgi:uncharacterized protein (TIGR02598 family)